ncbi:MAG: ABC transporter permease subunit [Candidatus Hodarchaeales archaeon]|jgi:ABC-type transport system involved in multi-copper enzyme maturation permease subunit
MSFQKTKQFAQSTFNVFSFEFRRDIWSKRAATIGVIFVMFNLMMLLSFSYMLTADAQDAEVPEVFQDPDSETWARLSVVLGSGLYFQLLGLGAICYFGAGALARDMNSGSLRLMQSNPVSRESNYLGRNASAFLTGYLLALLGSGFMTIGMMLVGMMAGIEAADAAMLVLEGSLKLQLVMIASFILATTATAALGTGTRSATIGAIAGIAFFLLIDTFLIIGASLFPSEWHLENLSFGHHQSEILLWLVGDVETGNRANNIPLESVGFFLVIPMAAVIVGITLYRKMDLD